MREYVKVTESSDNFNEGDVYLLVEEDDEGALIADIDFSSNKDWIEKGTYEIFER